QLPSWFHKATAVTTVFSELVVVGMGFLPRIFRMVCFFLVTLLQIGIILTANYAFLNYLVLALAIFLLDDVFLVGFVPLRWQQPICQRLSIDLGAKPWRQSFSSLRLLPVETPEAPEPDELSLLNPSAASSEVLTAAETGASTTTIRSWLEIISDAVLS